MYKAKRGVGFSKDINITNSDQDHGGLNELVKESVAAVLMDFARHSFKSDKLPDGREPLSEKGVVEAVKIGVARGEGMGDVARKKLKQSKPVSIYGSPRERTQQSSLFRQFGEVFKDVTFINIDPQDILRWLEDGGAIKSESSPLLNFQIGDAAYSKEAQKAFERNLWMKWLVEKSDDFALETNQDPENVTTLSIQAANVAAYIYAMGRMKTSEIMKDKESAVNLNNTILMDVTYITSHQGVTESFLYKVIKMEDKDAKAAKRFIEEELSNQGFKENEGFKVGYFALDENDPSNFKIIVSWKNREYELDSEDLEMIMKEGEDLKSEMVDNFFKSKLSQK